MSDNVTTQSTELATLPDLTKLAAVEATFSGETVFAGVDVLAKSSGAEGSRVLTLINPATEDKQDTEIASLVSIDGKLPALSGGSVPVSGPLTDAQLRATAVPVSGSLGRSVATAETPSNVGASVTSVTVLASNASRRGASLFNDSASACYVSNGTTASASSFKIKLFPYQYFEFPEPIYTGTVSAIWDSAVGNMRVTEVT